MSTYDVNRLYTLLLNTRLQTRDNPTYQVIRELIRAFAGINTSSSSSSGSGSAGADGLPGLSLFLDGLDGEDGFGIPGSPGIQGNKGDTGPTGPAGTPAIIILEGESGEDGLTVPGIAGLQGSQGIQGLQGNPGVVGPPVLLDGEQGEDGEVIPGPQGIQGIQGIPGTSGSSGLSILILEGEQGEDGLILPGIPGNAALAFGPSRTIFRRVEWWNDDTSTTVLFGQTTLNTANSSHSPDTAGPWLVLSSSTSGVVCSATFNSNFCWPDHNPIVRTLIRTDPSNVTSTRIWFGLTQNTAFVDTDSVTLASGKCVAIRFSTVAGDGGFVGVTADASAQVVSSTIVAVAANTIYILEIIVTGGGTLVTFNVYNSSGALLGTQTISTHIPTGVALKNSIAIIPQTNASRQINVRGSYTEAN